MNGKKTTIALALGLAFAACKAGSEGAGPSAPASAAPSRSIGPAVMLRHEVFSVAVRDAIVRGDLATAQRNARDLGAIRVNGSPEIAERAQTMSDAAKAIAAAPDLSAAARATGGLVQTCADCHARLTGPTRLAIEPAPRDEGGRRGRMRRHVWAMNELWDGLVGNSEAPWRAGAAALADPALASSELIPAKSRTPEVERLAEDVRTLGARAAAADDTTVRAGLYGELLATCADCHARTR